MESIKFYLCNNTPVCSPIPLPYPSLEDVPPEGEVVYLFHRQPLEGRSTFAVTAPSLLDFQSGGLSALLVRPAPPVPRLVADLIRQGRLRAVNYGHPRWRELLKGAFPLRPAGRKVRVHLLALGDVGSTLLMGLRLLGGDVVSSIGICDVREGVASRWEFELNQISSLDYGAFPAVEPVAPEEIFNCDVFLFCASRFVPDAAVKSGDVRMAQFEKNRPLVEDYARKARAQKFGGLFCVVSDPVDPLCQAALRASNRDENGRLDYQGLFPHQVRGFGLGVMNARAAYYARKDPRFQDFLIDGRTFGPHGEGLVVANSIAHYDSALSDELTALTLQANLEMRRLGYKPYVAPALSSGALSLLELLRGHWHCSSVCMDGVFLGVRNRLAGAGLAVERLALPDPLWKRILQAAAALRAIGNGP